MQLNRLVSVILCVYNGQAFVDRCVQSVLSQSYSDFEFIIIDDGSTDLTFNILKNYSIVDSRILLISQVNTGLTNSLNIALARCSGKYVARIDIDDVWYPDRLEKQVAFMDKHSLVLCGSNARFISLSTGVERIYKYAQSHSKILLSFCLASAYFPHSSVLFDRVSALNVKCYSASFKKSQDIDLWLKLSSVGRIGCCPEVLVDIYSHAHQITEDSSFSDQKVYAFIASCLYISFYRRKLFPTLACESELIDSIVKTRYLFPHFIVGLRHYIPRVSRSFCISRSSSHELFRLILVISVVPFLAFANIVIALLYLATAFIFSNTLKKMLN